MTHDQKISYMRICAGIAGFGIDEVGLDILVSTYELVLEKEGKANVEDALNVKHAAMERQNVKERQKMLDKVSEKVG
jgi:hypothetical protein